MDIEKGWKWQGYLFAFEKKTETAKEVRIHLTWSGTNIGIRLKNTVMEGRFASDLVC